MRSRSRALRAAMWSWLFRVFRPLVPPRDRVVVFGGNGGRLFADNSKYLFEHCYRTGTLEVYWYTRDSAVAVAVDRQCPGRALFHSSFRSFLVLLRARCFVISHGTADFAPFRISGGAGSVLNVWHGMPVKTIGYLDPGEDHGRLDGEVAAYNHVVAASDLERDVLTKCFRLPVEQIWITGRPRNEPLFAPDTMLSERRPELQKRIVLYAPTWRKPGSSTSFLPFPDADERGLLSVLQEFDSYLLLRHHRNERGFERLPEDAGGRIIRAGAEQFPDVSDLLPFVDVLITDYSSIYVDYLLLDRPVIFAVPDLEWYARVRGFSVNFEQFTPGPKVRSGAALLVALRAALAEPTRDSAARQKAAALFHCYRDGQASARLEERILRDLA